MSTGTASLPGAIDMHGYYYNTTMRFNRHWQDGGLYKTDVTRKNVWQMEEIAGSLFALSMDTMPFEDVSYKPRYIYVTMSSTRESAEKIGMQAIAVLVNVRTSETEITGQERSYTCPSYRYRLSDTHDLIWTKDMPAEKQYIAGKAESWGYPDWNGHTFAFDLAGIPDAREGAGYSILAAAQFATDAVRKMTVTTRIQIK